MKHILRNYLVNLGGLWATSQILPALSISGGAKGLLIGALAFMGANLVLVPIIKVLLLPLNLLTLGIFAWLANVLALYLLMIVVPYFELLAYHFPGLTISGFVVPAMDLSTFQVAIAVSFLMGFIIHLFQWLIKN